MLLVEDSEDDALLIVRELQRGGYEPAWKRVETPEAMREALAGSDWSVIVSDHRMPRFGPFEPLALYRQSGSEASFVVVSGTIIEGMAIEATKDGADDYVMKDDLARLCVAVERGLRETAQRRRAERELKRRDAILDAVRFAAERLLGEAVGWEESIRAVLGRLGEATGVSRVYVFESYTGDDGSPYGLMRYEWVAEGVTSQMAGQPARPIRYEAAGYGRWVRLLGRGEPVYGHARDFPENERLALNEEGILSILAVPIFAGGEWWGHIGFDETRGEREWSRAEVSALGSAAGTLGAAIRRKRVDEALRASEAELRAVFGAMNDIVLVLDGEGRYLKVAPTTSSMLYRSPEELVGRTVYDTFPPEQADTILGGIRHSLKTQERVDIEYGLRVLGQDMWFSATFSPMTQDTVVAVARVITEQAKMRRLLEGRVATLSRVAASLTLDQPIERTLDTLAESMVRASGAVACLIALNDKDTDKIRLVGTYGVPEGYKAGLQTAYNMEGDQAPSPSREALRTGRPVLFRDARQAILDNPLRAPVHQFVREAPWDTVYIVPLLSRGKALGTIHFGYPQGQEPSEDERAFLQAVADQAAVAVENARLFSETRGKAALEERQRLARELHDSVSQALYGIALGSKTAREEFDDNPAEVPELLDYVLSLAEAGMAEMRALIFELRPESLQTEGVVAALEKQAAALEARHGITVETDLCDEPAISLETKEAVYRIVQETLHNTAKHARASSVKIRMRCAAEQITLEISDDGIGFEPRGDFPGHLGLRSMRERAQRVGGTLEVQSAPGTGTRVRAGIPL